MACILLACLIGKVPCKVLVVYHSLLYFICIRDHLNIPKIHSMVHYVESICYFGCTDNYNTEVFERLHIDLAMDTWRATWRATNKRNERP
ncbi:hypothetical protein DFJ58DRAFT_668594 [Suillus subalutaceus]|uniref:uncharacterized protein n=1 Tax=Suillus subalutaceus TaxID=48586 RepID=UPI001B88692B|nr:uncharacterized protein DFJ58DRAFT_668594 [Suillus subalutaceus]KAG1837980.1 hypothetical protein DFJ58DRAFT_668594 [Suillus subalutaceus]